MVKEITPREFVERRAGGTSMTLLRPSSSFKRSRTSVR